MRLDGDEGGQDEPWAFTDFPRGPRVGSTLKPIRTMSTSHYEQHWSEVLFSVRHSKPCSW